MARKTSKFNNETIVEVKHTLQVRLNGNASEPLSDADDQRLTDLARRYNAAKRRCYAVARRLGVGFDHDKAKLCADFDLPARLANAIATDLKGMVASKQEKAKFDAVEVAGKLERAQKTLTRQRAKRDKLAEGDISRTKLKRVKRDQIHTTETIQRLTARLARLNAITLNPYPSLCFGSRSLFNAQHHLADNCYADHYAWREDWRGRRESQFLVVGSADEASGNKTCRGRVNADGSVDLTLAVAAGRGPESVTMTGLWLPFGHADWVQSIVAAEDESAVARAWQLETARLVANLRAGFGDDAEAAGAAELALRKDRKRQRAAEPDKQGAALTYRFIRDPYGWRLLITLTQPMPVVAVKFDHGAIGIDLNDGFVAATLVDGDGAMLAYRRFDLTLAGLGTGQHLAKLHDVAQALIHWAKDSAPVGRAISLPLVIETLDFAEKKSRLKEVGCARSARRLSSFAYSKFAAILHSHGQRHGVAVVEVNPAFTSVIGAAIHAVPHGLTVHGAAAMAIARRAMSVEETIPSALRLWQHRRRPMAFTRPLSLRSKATVNPYWSGWKVLAKAVHDARKSETSICRETGTRRRLRLREQRSLDADVAFLLTTYG